MKLCTAVFFLFLLFLNKLAINAEDRLLNSNFEEIEYKQTEEVFYASCDHVEQMTRFIVKKVLPGLHSRDAFLDIGPGPGHITQAIGKNFSSTAVIEPNRAYAPLYEENGYLSLFANFQDARLDTSFDLVLCAHVLYHVEHPTWPSFLKKIYSIIRKDGKGVVVLIAPKGDFHALCSSINPHYSNSSVIEPILNTLNMRYEKTETKCTFNASNYKDFHRLIQLFTIEDCYTPEQFATLSEDKKTSIEEKISQFIQKCKQPDESYQLVFEDAYFVISK
jgi:hypothetical protein